MATFLGTVFQDVRYALRQLRRTPGFAATAVVTLALGIGANAAIFSLLDQALLRSLPVREPRQLVLLEGTGKAWSGRTSGHGGEREMLFSVPMYRDLYEKNTVLQGIVATSTGAVGIERHGETAVQDAEIVSGNYFSLLGVRPALGRVLTAADDTDNAAPVGVLSYDYWHDRLGSDPAVLDETLRISGKPVTIVGVAAPEFRSAVWGQTPALFVPLAHAALVDPSQADSEHNHRDRWLNLVGRLRDGVSPAAAEAGMTPLWHALRADELAAMGSKPGGFTADFLTNSRLHLLEGATGLSYSRQRLEKPLLIVMCMAGLMLLLAAVNVAGLLLVRSAVRAREFCVRYALGATAGRIVRQVLLEGFLLGFAGAVLGVALAPMVVRVLSSRLTDPGDPLLFLPTVDGRMLAVSFALAMVVSLGFSVVPAIQLRKPDLVSTLKQQGSTSAGRGLNLRSVAVSLQVALSVLLLVCAGLLVRSLQNLRHVDVGFNTEQLLTLHIDPELAGYPADRIAPLQRDVLAALSGIPGVRSVAATDSAEIAGSDSGTNVTVEGYTAPPEEDLDIGRIGVSPLYFATLQEPLVAGRAFTENDTLDHPPVAIVNQSFARHYFGSATAALGKRMARGAGNKLRWMEIVGVVRDARHIGLRDDVKMTDFTPLAQEKKAADVTLYLRTAEEPQTVFRDVTATMHRVAPMLALQHMMTMGDQVDRTLADERTIGLLAAAFGVLATGLAGIGLYGVLAYNTAQRTREIGIRMALGSSRAAVSRLVLAEVLLLAGAGVLAGLPCALLLARMLRSQLYGVSATDPVTLASVAMLMLAVALVSALLPARRAAHVDPNQALRSE